jgi:3-oxoacyl-(acyl-carrier-protein) synthase
MRRVAITGVGVVSALGDGLEAHLDAFAAGRGGIGPITRFAADGWPVQLAAEAPLRPLSDPVAESLAQRDPKIGFAWRAADEACARAGRERLPADALVHLGTSLEVFDLQQLVTGDRIDLPACIRRCLAPGAPPLQLPLDTATTLIARTRGPCGDRLTNASACAAGTQAIGHAFQAVRAGRCPLALCGGFDSLVNPFGIGGMYLLGALSTDRTCRPFDATRAGTVIGEGAAIVVLEDLAVARAAGRPLLAEIRGYGSSLDAHSPSAPDADGDGACRAMRAALADAGLPPAAIGHVNTHGTGTYLNDEVEARALRTVLGETWPRVPVSAVKGLTGHCIGAGGPIELVAALLPLLRGVLPPNPGLAKVGSGCELDHVTVPGRPFAGGWILKNSLGFGGQNACLVLGRPEDG